MVKEVDISRERRVLSKILGLRVAKEWGKSNITTRGATDAGKTIVAKLSDEAVLWQLAKLKMSQSSKSIIRGAIRQSDAQAKEATRMDAKRVMIKSTRIRK